MAAAGSLRKPCRLPSARKSSWLEYATDGVRVDAVCPGYITTPMTEETVRNRYDDLMAKVPVRRMGLPEEIAETVVFLCSDRASFITGAAYTVGGGYTAS
jgi:NAD(P)-dependent dehydrogenase (short-subunit alcohol dehydrogenase family)